MANDSNNTPLSVKDLLAAISQLGDKMAAAQKEGIALGIAMAAKEKGASAASLFDDPYGRNLSVGRMDHGVRCQACGQYLVLCAKKEKDGKTPVKDEKTGEVISEHTSLVVWPKTPLGLKYFPGMTINGVTYLSSHAAHRVTVPTCMLDSVIGGMERFEINEEEQALGRSFNHFSGAFGQRGAIQRNDANNAGDPTLWPTYRGNARV